MDEETIIRNRIAVDQRPLKKLVRRFETLKRVSVSSQSPESVNVKLALDTFSTELAAYNASVVIKQRSVLRMNQTQQEHFAAELNAVKAGIEATRRDIAALQIQLTHEEAAKRRRGEYDVVARACLEVQSREESERNMATLQEEIQGLQQSQQRLTQAHEFRKTLLHNVINAIYTMKDAINGPSQDAAAAASAMGGSKGKLKRGNDANGSSVNLLGDGAGAEDAGEEEGEEGEETEGGARRAVGGAEEDEEGAVEDKMDES
ncbi:hypothetical protein BC830DRAFT_1124325 [Chytriomyces sp. MP71]|nr:hypothetical protein BC830DRAFT_1124325 [Chytriomyces sp. MP71]